MRPELILTTFVVFGVSACNDPTAIVIEPLRIINWSPSSGAFCVDAGVRVRATFSDDLDIATVDETTFSLRNSDGAVDASVAYEQQSFTLTLTPDEPLQFDRLYTAVAAQGLRGMTQGTLAVAVESSFQTVARSGCNPGVECTLPSDCDGTQICSNIGVCIDECVTDRDCYHATCSNGACVPQTESDGGAQDSDSEDPDQGDPTPGD